MIINDRIRAQEIRVIDEDGKQLGIIKREDALKLADEKGLDLVLLNPNLVPPVAKLTNYGKLKYEMQKKEKQAKKSSKTASVQKELKLSPKISEHDIQVRLTRGKEFLGKGHKVKFVVNFKGRESTHPDIGERILRRLIEDLKDFGVPEFLPKFEGRSMMIIMMPK